MVAWTTTSQPLIGSKKQEYVPQKKGSIDGRQIKEMTFQLGSLLGGVACHVIILHGALLLNTAHEIQQP